MICTFKDLVNCETFQDDGTKCTEDIPLSKYCETCKKAHEKDHIKEWEIIEKFQEEIGLLGIDFESFISDGTYLEEEKEGSNKMSMVSNGYSESYSIASSTKSSAKIQVSHKTY